MRPSDVASALRSLIPTRRPVFIWGPPGIGKSAVVHQAAQALDMPVIDVRAVLLDPVDLRGLPMIDHANRQAHWCPPSFLPRGGRCVLLLDETPQAPPMVQASLMQLTLDRRIGEYVLPEECTVLSAGNRQEDRAGAHRLITPLLNRFIHLDLEVDYEDWNTWAVQAGVAHQVRSFLRFMPGVLFDFDPQSQQRAFASPRSWSFVSDVLAHTPRGMLFPIVAGCVGEGPAVQFIAHMDRCEQLPDPDEVLNNPERAHVPTEPSLMWALSGALVERIRDPQKADLQKLGRFIRYLLRREMSEEFSVLSFKDGVAVRNDLTRAPGASEWLRNHKHMINPSLPGSQ